VNAVMKFMVPYNAGKLSRGSATGGLPSGAQLHTDRERDVHSWNYWRSLVSVTDPMFGD
jgi:hypothetical protein